MKRPVLLLAVLAVLVVAVVGHTLVLAPKTSERAAVRERLAAAADEEDTLRVDLVRLQRLAAGTKVSEAELERLRSLVPDTADLASFIRPLDDVAARSGVKWSSLTPGPPVAGAHGTTVGISISVGGTFFQLLRYLSALETLNRLVVIDSVTLTPAAGGAGSPVMQATFEGRVFSAGPAPVDSQADEQPPTATLRRFSWR